MIYYGDISKYKNIEYLKEIFENSQEDFSKLEKMYAEQIVINSMITYRKNQYSKIAIVFISSAIMTLPIGILIWYFLSKKSS